MERPQLIAATRDFCDRVLAPHLPPGTHYLAQRAPVHVLYLGLIREIYPDGRVAHIIRDGRDVSRSLVAKQWGPDSIEEAAKEWRESVLRARREHGPGPYVEVIYERLL